MGILVAREAVGTLAEELRQRGRRIVLTNGCFDLLHVGHLRYLQAARALGDVLLVGVNADEQVRAQKGPGRPFVPEDDRVELVAGLAPVDYAFVFAEPTACELLAAIRPHVYAKGGDYILEVLPESHAAASCGAKVVFLPFVPGRSSSGLAMAIAAQLEAAGLREGGE